MLARLKSSSVSLSIITETIDEQIIFFNFSVRYPYENSTNFTPIISYYYTLERFNEFEFYMQKFLEAVLSHFKVFQMFKFHMF